MNEKKQMSIWEAAQIMEISEQSLRILLQRKSFPWGMAWKGRGRSYQYYINRRKFLEAFGND